MPTLKGFTFKNQTETSADLYFYGDIVSDWWGAWQDEDQYPDAIKNFLSEQEGKDLNVYVNSGGGSVFAGIAIYNMIKRHAAKANVKVYVDGLAGSIASILAFAGSEPPEIPSNAFLMIHNPWSYCEGNAADMRKMADDLDQIRTGILNIYAEHLKEGVTIDQIEALMDAESWLNGANAAEYFEVKTTEAKEYAAAVGDYMKKDRCKVPEKLKIAKDGHDPEQQAAEEAARELEKQTLEQEAEMQETEAQEAGAQEAETQDVETRETIEAPVPSAPAPQPQTRSKTSQPEEIPLGNPEELERLDQEEERWGPDELWNRFRKHYPKMQAFDSPGTVEILSIRPQDIGLLPRENWGYGNNSFLLHGYYNYRYLIFARVGDEKHARSRYILGVPGHYYSNEKYMASMFGFHHFVLAKTQPAQDGRFGYWYADVRMENVE